MMMLVYFVFLGKDGGDRSDHILQSCACRDRVQLGMKTPPQTLGCLCFAGFACLLACLYLLARSLPCALACMLFFLTCLLVDGRDLFFCDREKGGGRKQKKGSAHTKYIASGDAPSFYMPDNTASTLNVVALVLIIVSVGGRLLLRACQGPVVHYVPVQVRRRPGNGNRPAPGPAAASRSPAVVTATTTATTPVASSELELTMAGVEEGRGVPCSQ